MHHAARRARSVDQRLTKRLSGVCSRRQQRLQGCRLSVPSTPFGAWFPRETASTGVAMRQMTSSRRPHSAPMASAFCWVIQPPQSCSISYATRPSSSCSPIRRSAERVIKIAPCTHRSTTQTVHARDSHVVRPRRVRDGQTAENPSHFAQVFGDLVFWRRRPFADEVFDGSDYWRA